MTSRPITFQHRSSCCHGVALRPWEDAGHLTSHMVLNFLTSPVLKTTPAGYMVVPHFPQERSRLPEVKRCTQTHTAWEQRIHPQSRWPQSPQSAPLRPHVGKTARLMPVSAVGPHCSQLSCPNGWATNVLLLKSNLIRITPLAGH